MISSVNNVYNVNSKSLNESSKQVKTTNFSKEENSVYNKDNVTIGTKTTVNRTLKGALLGSALSAGTIALAVAIKTPVTGVKNKLLFIIPAAVGFGIVGGIVGGIGGAISGAVKHNSNKPLSSSTTGSITTGLASKTLG